jgi:hypothetical protein
MHLQRFLEKKKKGTVKGTGSGARLKTTISLCAVLVSCDANNGPDAVLRVR